MQRIRRHTTAGVTQRSVTHARRKHSKLSWFLFNFETKITPVFSHREILTVDNPHDYSFKFIIIQDLLILIVDSGKEIDFLRL